MDPGTHTEIFGMAVSSEVKYTKCFFFLIYHMILLLKKSIQRKFQLVALKI
jgi:hypothetical protein